MSNVMYRGGQFRYGMPVGKSLYVLSLYGFVVAATFSSFFGIDSTPASFLVRALTFFLSIFFLMDRFIKNSIKIDFFVSLLIIFSILYSLRIYVDTLVLDRELSKPDYVFWFWWIGACTLPALAISQTHSSSASRALGALVIISVSCTVTALIVGDNFFIGEAGGNAVDIGRLSLASINPIVLGHSGLTTSILCLGFFFEQSDYTSRGRWLSVLAVAGVLLGLLLLILSASRGPFVAAIFVALVWLYLRARRAFLIFFFFVMFPVLFLFLGPIRGILVSLDFNLVARLLATSSADDQSAFGRIHSLSEAFSQFFASPIFGSSLEVFSTGYYPHNLIAESFMAVGVVGGFVYLCLNFLGLRYCFLIISNHRENSWMACIFLQYFFASLVSGSLWNLTLLWGSLAGVYACTRSKAYSERFRIARHV